jgi:hypothetical protein
MSAAAPTVAPAHTAHWSARASWLAGLIGILATLAASGGYVAWQKYSVGDWSRLFYYGNGALALLALPFAAVFGLVGLRLGQGHAEAKVGLALAVFLLASDVALAFLLNSTLGIVK